MTHKARLNFLMPLLLMVLLFQAISTGQAQGFFPDATFSKPLLPTPSGKIKFREDWLYKFTNGKMTPLGIKIGYDRYDSLGMKVEEANYDLKGNPLLEVTYTYDEWGREAQCLGYRESKIFYRKWAYDFIDSSKCLEKRVFNNASKEKWIYRFDAAGNIVEEINYNANGELNYRYVIKYTTFNKPAEIVELSGNGTLYEKWIYLYNKRNQNIEVMQFDAGEELFKKYLNTFDEFGNQKEIMTVDKNGIELERTVSLYQFFK